MAEDRIRECDNWFDKRFRPVAMTGILKAYLDAHFSDPLSIENLRLAGEADEPLRADGPLTTGQPPQFVTVESITKWRPDLTNKRPAVIIRREDLRTEKMSIGDRVHGGGVEPDGSIRYSILLHGNHTLFCIGRSGASAELLGEEVANEMCGFHPDIRRKLGLMRFGLAGMGKLFKLEEPKKHYVVPVSVAYSVEHSWRRIPAAPTLKRITFETTLP